MTWVYAFLSYHLHKIYTVMYILEFWILSRFQIEHTATLNVRVYACYVNDIPVNQAVQFLALFRLNWCSIQCSGWCSSWQVSWDSLDEYWRRNCFLIESSFAFHNAMNMCGCYFYRSITIFNRNPISVQTTSFQFKIRHLPKFQKQYQN